MALAYLASKKPDHAATMSSPPQLILTQDELKKIAAYKAVEFVESGMVLGLGTGSTAKHAIDRIGELLKQGKLTNIIGIPTSTKTHQHASSLGIPLSDLDTHPVLDLAIDGADEVDPDMNLVKGRGGSLLREKMIEGCCKKFVVIVDESKLVDYVGQSGLAMPVEVVPFCWKFTAQKLQSLFGEACCVAKLRTTSGENDAAYVTDNGNYIVDLYFEKEIGDLKAAGDAMLRLGGVVEHGMFIDMATTLIVAGEFGVTVRLKGVELPGEWASCDTWRHVGLGDFDQKRGSGAVQDAGQDAGHASYQQLPIVETPDACKTPGMQTPSRTPMWGGVCGGTEGDEGGETPHSPQS